MNRLALIVLTTCALLAPIRATWPQTTTPGVDPGVPPGTETPQVDILLQGEAPQPLMPEIQPGTETPRGGDTGMAPGTTLHQSGGGDGTETEDELYVGRKATGLLPETPAPEIQPGTETPRAGDTGMGLGTGPLPGTQNSGDEDDIEDLQVERLTIQGGDMLQDATGVSPAAASPQLPGQPASGSLDLSTVGMKPKDAGGGEPQPTAKTPRFKAGKVLKDSLNLTGEPTRRENCGTVLTGLIDDPDSDVNPCPTGCERGEQLWVKTYESGDTRQYEASYQCYMPAIPTLSMPADAPSSGENCGTYWTGWMDTLDAGVNPCPQGCLRGQKPTVKTGLSGHGIKYDVNYQCYMPEIPSLAMPADAPSSGENCGTYWTGWMDTLDTAVNPCPQNCVRGQKPTVKTGLSDHGIKYDVNYQCYTATTTMAADARAPKPITDASTAPQPIPGRAAGGTAALEPSTNNIDVPIATKVQAVGGAPQGVSVVGGGTASSASGIDAAPIAARGSSAVANRLISMDNLEGPGTTITAITDVTITSLTVKWKPVPGASAYVLQATAVGLNNAVAGSEIPQPATLPNEMTGLLTGLATGVDNTVWVSVRYPDGARGMSDTKNVAMLPAENPKEFKAVDIGPGAVRLEWQASSGAIHYFVEGDNLPRTQTTNTAVAVTNLTPGTHEWTLIAAYPPGVYDDLNPSRLLATVAPDVGGRARYRVTINGFRVDRETMDDALQTDGKGDEVYAAVYVAEYNSKNGERLRSDVTRTPVFGDKSGFGPDRVLAGNAGSTGGLRRGDAYPGTNPAVRASAPSHLDMPFIVWEGELVAGENHIALIPSIWEWDGSAGGFDFWSNSLRSSAPEARYQLQAALQQAVAEKRFSSWPGAHLSPPSLWGRSDAVPSMVGDRLIGLLAPSPGSVQFQYFDRTFAINREFAEAELARTDYTSLPPGVFSIRFQDAPQLGSNFGGDYTIYLQVERLP